MPEVKNCCCCISLRAGTITFGVLSCIASMIVLIFFALGVKDVNDRIENIISFRDSTYPPLDYFQTILDSLAEMKAEYIAIIVISVIFALLFMLLICGAVRRNTCILMTWIVILWIGILADCIGLIAVPFQIGFTTGGELAIIATIYFVTGVLTAYHLIVVHSYRKQILREKSSGTVVYAA